MVDKLVFPEFIQENCHIDTLFNAVNDCLYNTETIKMQKKYCHIGTDLLYATDENGKKIPAHTAAALAIKNIL
jgi:lipid A disaccharide synthetase